MHGTSAPRRYDVDWLRVFATYLLFVFHTGKVFDVAPFYHIKNAELSPSLDLLTGCIHQWHMPLFFLLAGWSARASLASRDTGAFLRERVSRLFIPFLAGCMLLCPLLKYIELLRGMPMLPGGRVGTAAGFQESFFAFLPTFFTRFDRFTWAHLWFLLYLFVFTLLYLPLFIRMLRRPAVNADAWPRLVVYLPIIPLALIQVTLRGRWPGFQNLYDDWANFSYYSLYFILGFVLAQVPGLEAAVHREWKRAGLIGVGALLLMVPTGGGTPVAIVLNRALSGVAGWCCVVAWLGVAARFLDFSNRALRYLSESAFPVYILHQLGIVVVGYFVIQLSAGIGIKFLLVLVGALVATLSVYHCLVRPAPPLRFLFGMKAVAPRHDRRRDVMPAPRVA